MLATAPRHQGLTIDRFHREVRIDGARLRLTYREFELLCFLAARPRRPVSRSDLIREVWQDRAPGGDVSLRTVDTHVRRLRVKLGGYARVLTTIRGRGYRFDPGPDVRYVAA
jgi:DNA-binding response OmpR family regulator